MCANLIPLSDVFDRSDINHQNIKFGHQWRIGWWPCKIWAMLGESCYQVLVQFESSIYGFACKHCFLVESHALALLHHVFIDVGLWKSFCWSLLDLSGLLPKVFSGVLFARFRALYLEVYMCMLTRLFSTQKAYQFCWRWSSWLRIVFQHVLSRYVNTALVLSFCLYQL